MIDKPFDDIELSDLELLVGNAVAGSRMITYKHKLPVDTDAEKKEFLAEVSAFANTVGGDLLVGVASDNGRVERIEGIDVGVPENLIAKYEDIIETGIAPKVAFVTKVIYVAGCQFVLLFRVARSWNPPHRVNHQVHDGVYMRNAHGKYLLSAKQVWQLFTTSQAVHKQIRDLREERISEISSENPPNVASKRKAVLHVFPLDSFNPGYNLKIESLAGELATHPLNCAMADINCSRALYAESKKHSMRYIQLFRSGTVEIVAGITMENMSRAQENAEAETDISILAYEGVILRSYRECFSLAKKIGMRPPVFLCLTFIDVQGCRFYENESGGFPMPGREIEVATLHIPEMPVHSHDFHSSKIMYSLFDSVRDVFGMSEIHEEKKKIFSLK